MSMMMKAEYVNPFLESASLVFRDMLGTELLRGKTSIKNDGTPTHEIAMILGITGNVTGQIIYSMNKETAFKLVRKLMPGVDDGTVESEYKDVLGEIANMITGNAINIFLTNDKDLDVTVPQVVDTRIQTIRVSKNPTLGLNLYSRFGMLEVNIMMG